MRVPAAPAAPTRGRQPPTGWARRPVCRRRTESPGLVPSTCSLAMKAAEEGLDHSVGGLGDTLQGEGSTPSLSSQSPYQKDLQEYCGSGPKELATGK